VIAIVLNGEPKEIAAGQSILDLVLSLNLPSDRLAVEHNLKIVKRDQWNGQRLQDGDKVEIVQFVGGGSAGIG
jgi:thiamine biosynthesis protein ThiS